MIPRASYSLAPLIIPVGEARSHAHDDTDTPFEDEREGDELVDGQERQEGGSEDGEGSGSGGGGDDADGGALESAFEAQRDGAEIAMDRSNGGRLHMISLADVVAAEIHRRASNPPELPPEKGTSSSTHSHVTIDRPPHGHLPSDGTDADETGACTDAVVALWFE